MPVYELTSAKTGQNYRVDFDRDPVDADVDEAVNHFDAEFARQNGVAPEVLDQGPLGTVGAAVRNVGPEMAGMVAGGMRYLDKAAEVVGNLTGTERGGLFADVAAPLEALQEEGQRLRPLNPANPTARTIGQGMAQGIGLLGTAAASVPALGARGMMAVPAALGFAGGAGEGLQTAEDMGITSPAAQLGMGTAFGAIEGATEMIGGIGGRFLPPLRGLPGAAAAIGTEAGEEMLSQTLQDATTAGVGQFMSDPSRPGYTRSGFKLPAFDAAMLERLKQAAIGGAAGGAVFAGVQALSPNDNLPPNQTTPAPQPGAPANATAALGGVPAAAVPLTRDSAAVNAEFQQSALSGIAQRAGAVDPLLPEHVSDLSAADVADLETNSLGDGGAGNVLRASIDEAVRTGRPFTPEELAFMLGQPPPAPTPAPIQEPLPTEPGALPPLMSRAAPRMDFSGLMRGAQAVASGQQAPQTSAALAGMFAAPTPGAPAGARPAGNGGARGVRRFFETRAPVEAGGPAGLQAAYATAATGSATQMLPLADVFAAAQAQNPALTPQQFQAQVMAGYDNGSVLLEGSGSLEEAQAAPLRIDGTPVGTAVRMMVMTPPDGGMTNGEGRMTNAEAPLRNPAGRNKRPGDLSTTGSGIATISEQVSIRSPKADAVLPAVESFDSFQSAPELPATDYPDSKYGRVQQQNALARLMKAREALNLARIRYHDEERASNNTREQHLDFHGRERNVRVLDFYGLTPRWLAIGNSVATATQITSDTPPVILPAGLSRSISFIRNNTTESIYADRLFDENGRVLAQREGFDFEPYQEPLSLTEARVQLIAAEAELFQAAEAEGGTAERLASKESAAEWRRRQNAAAFAALLDSRDEEANSAGSKFVAKVWGIFAQNDETFQYGKTTSKNADDIAAAVSLPGSLVTARQSGGTVRFSGANGYLDIHEADTSRPYIRSTEAESKGKKGGGGAQLYQAALDWIHNNGKRIKDDSGLTDINAVRRTSNFASSALRWGTSKHLKPHAKQGLAWGKNNTLNIASLLTKEMDHAFKAIAEARDWVYDFTSDQFTDSAGQPLERERFEQAVIAANPATSGIGVATLERAVVTRSAIEAFQSGRSEELVSALGVREDAPERLKRVLYSPSELAANQKANEVILKNLGLPTAKGTRVWGASKVKGALAKLSTDERYPATTRLMARELSSLSMDNLLLKIEADARLNWAGLYQPFTDGRGELSLNTRSLGRGYLDVGISLVHEALHHATYRALRAPKTARQKQAKADLEALFQRAKAALAVNEQFREFDYELSNLDEFITGLWTRADFQTALAGIPLENAPTLGQRVRSVLDEIFRVLAELVTGKQVPTGSVLEASMAATLRIMGDGRTQAQQELSPVPLMNPAAEQRENRSRFARPDEQERWYETRADHVVQSGAEAWLDGRTLDAAIEQLGGKELPAGITSEDVRQQVFGLAIRRAMQLLDQGDEFARSTARVLANKLARLYQDAGRESARAMRQRAVVNHELQPYAPILAAEGVLIDRADAVMDKRFDGGAVGGAAKVKKVADDSSAEAGGELGADIEAETAGTETSPQGTKVPAQKRRGALKQKQPNLARLLNELRKKMFPGMNWQAIFEQLPSQQRERQRELYTRLRKDQRLRNLNQSELLQLTNELDKAWQRERRKVFMRELGKAGALGEKDASDRQKAQKAMPKLLRAINLGLMTSETFREAVAPEYGLRMLTQAEASQLRSMAEKAYEQPVGVLRNKLLAEMLANIQTKVKGTRIEILNSYWTAAVLSGLRTQFDTFMAAANGLGTNLIQAGTLAARGKFTASKEVHAEWWRGFGEGARESLRILAKGDYSLTKRFNLDLQKALEGDEHYRPVPLRETLFQEANWWQKAPAAVMMFVGRAMTAADHINNTATTRGAMAVARALNPELYAHKAGYTVTEREAAFQQALNEVSGGSKINLTKDQQATLSARTREILYSGVKPDDAAAASEVGDMAAYQNDPTGVFGWLYDVLKSGLGRGAAKLGAVSENVDNTKATRLMAALVGGAMYGITGTRFMRFGFNFGADITRYVPGTYLADSLGFYGQQTSQQQRDLLLGKNVVGLLIASSIAAMFLGKDDEDEGWHIEGPWNSLSLTDKNARRSAGIEPLSMWKRENGKITRVYYKQWPTMGIFAAVGGMADEQRFEPGKFEQRGVTGHLLHAAATGLTQIQNVSAMRNLGELFGSPSYGVNQEDALVDKMSKTATNYVSGFVPRVIKDVDAWFDPQNYKPDGIMEQLIADQPVLRRLVNDGRPQLSVLGKPVQLNRAPWSRVTTTQSIGPEERVLAQLMVRGINLPGASDKKMVTRDGTKQTLESLGADVSWRYQKAVGEGYAELLRTNGQQLLTLPADQAQKWINTSADRIKSIAMMKVMQP